VTPIIAAVFGEKPGTARGKEAAEVRGDTVAEKMGFARKQIFSAYVIN
jgi:hypothetical protein